MSSNDTIPPFTQATLIDLWCAEPIFFASRELSDTYYTEGTIGNYALAYALGWARSPYRLQGKATHRPTYVEDLTPLHGDRYILPAWPTSGRATYRSERFNALSDSYWFAMTNNRVATAREDLPLMRAGKKPSSYRPSNFPQTGRLKLIERGNHFQTLVFGDVALPNYIRVGKFMSKVKLTTLDSFSVTALPSGDYHCATYLNSADLPPNLTLTSYDLISIPPASLLKNTRFKGSAMQVGDWVLPNNLQFCGMGSHE